MSWSILDTVIHGLAVSFPVVGGVALGVGASIAHKHAKLNQILEEHIQAYRKRYPLEQSIQELEFRKGELEGDIRSLDASRIELERKKAELAVVERTLKGKEEELHEKSTQLAQIKQQEMDYERLRVHYDSLAEDRNLLETEVKSLKQDKETLKGEQKTLEEGLRGLADKWRDEQQKANQLKENIDTLETRRTETQANLDQLEAKRIDVQKVMTGLEQNILELGANKATLQGDVEQLQAQQGQLQGDIVGLTERQQALSTQVTELTAELERKEALRQEFAELEVQIGKLREEAKEKEERFSFLEGKIKEMEARLAESEADAAIALETLHRYVLPPVPVTDRPLEGVDEVEFLAYFESYLAECGFSFHRRLLRAFHTSLKIQDISSLVVLAGISGTGKSELPQLYARFANADKLVVPVQPRWDSPQDLLGFYNYMEKQYKPTELVRALRQIEHDDTRQDRLMLVLLDEMNLARVEYYFSDFLSKLESRRNHKEQSFVELDFGNLSVEDEQRRLSLSKRVLFVGTMNEDESTQTLSDKVLDRAGVLTFPRPQHLKLFRERTEPPASPLPGYLTASLFDSWSQPSHADIEAIRQDVEQVLEQANVILENLDRPFGHRVSQAVLRYVLCYPGVVSAYQFGDKTAMWHAISDQLAQKVITKLRGVPLEPSNKRILDEFGDKVVYRIPDPLLHRAYETAHQHEGHAFVWKGLQYDLTDELQDESLTAHV